jgi:large subunit ribosomal protein L6
MSRVGKKPIPLPQGVKINLGPQLEVEGPKGKLAVPIPAGIRVERNNNHLELVRENDKLAALHGYSHSIEVNLPAGVDLRVDKQTHLVLTGYDKQAVGQVAAHIRALRSPDPYKNKGVRYTGEALRKKAGKTGAGGK